MINEHFLEQDVKSALSWVKTFKYLRIALATFLITSYVMEIPYFHELLLSAVILLLLFPMGFADTFFEKLLEYNTSLLEKRQTLNAEQANEHFTKVFDDIEEIKLRLNTMD